jgi:hypothetical protein
MNRGIKRGIWLYLLLLVFEGALRKWVAPGASDALLLVRDPVVAGIYLLALINGTVPRNGFLALTFALAVASFVFAFLAGQGNIYVTLFGVRTNYFHLPLIWIMAETLDRRDVRRMGFAVLLIAIPMTLLMIAQFRAPADAWVNRGAGGGEGGQIHGAMGRIRPPGFFSFITGPMAFFPLATAFFLSFLTDKWRALSFWLIVTSGLFIALALPVSISRGVAIICGCVGAVFVAGMIIKGAFNASFFRVAFGALILVVGLSFLPVFEEARMVFMDRWNTAAAEVEGDAWGSLTERVTTGFTSPFQMMMDQPFFGRGIGMGSNVAAKLLTGGMGFLLSENEWERAMQELGPLLGLGFVGLRVALWVHLLLVSWRALRRESDLLPLLLTAAGFSPIMLQQWSQATQLGFAVFIAGITLAAVNHPPEDEDADETDDDEEEDSEDAEDEEDDGDEDADEADDRRRGKHVAPGISTAAPEATPDPISEYEKRRRRLRGLA